MQEISKQESINNRITVIDAMRGLTLIGICATHAFQHFGAFSSNAAAPFPWIGTMDEVSTWILQYLIMGKFFIIFSFLFGLSFFIQMDSAAKKGIDFRGRFVWRLTLLFLIGLVHSAIFRNDILIIYAVLGLPLVLMYRLPHKWLLSIALFFVLGGAQLAYIGYKSIVPAATPQQVEAPAERRARWQEIFLNGDFSENIRHNTTEQLSFKFNFQFGESGRAYMTMGFFILGLLAGRIRLFQNLDRYRNQLIKAAWIALGLVLLLYALKPYLPQGPKLSLSAWLAIPMDSLINLLSAYLWVILMIELYRKTTIQKRLGKIVSYGRMGLTNYMLQSVLGVLIFYGYGLALHHELGVFLSVMVCLLYTILQIQLSHYWLKNFRYGPIEWLWRSGTYLKWQPLKIKRLMIITLLLATSISAHAQDQQKALTIAQQGSFAIGGIRKTEPGKFELDQALKPQGQTFHGDHAYVFYQTPVKARKYPLVFLHGAGQSKKTWESTPDGREGFQNLFLRRGFSVYLLDQPRRGEAGKSTVAATISSIPDEQFWFTQFRIGNYPDYFQNVQFPKDAVSLEQFYRQMTPNTGAFDPIVVTDAVSKLFDKIGAGILITHSQAGGPGWLTAIKNERVKAVVAYEPYSGFVFPEGELPDPIKSTGLFGELKGTEISLSDFMKLTRIPIVIYYGDYIAKEPSKVWNMDHWRSGLEMARIWAATINKHGGNATVVHLPEIGIHGNTHFPFADLNNIEVADVLSSWLKKQHLD